MDSSNTDKSQKKRKVEEPAASDQSTVEQRAGAGQLAGASESKQDGKEKCDGAQQAVVLNANGDQEEECDSPVVPRAAPNETNSADSNRAPQRREKLTILTAGDSGLGKTAFADCFLVKSQQSREHDGESTTCLSCRSFEAEIDKRDGGGKLKFTVYDTVGYGSDSQNIYRMSDVESVILEKYSSHDAIDLCLYFLAPHRIKDKDFEFMKKLSKIITVVVLVAKSDSMTLDERSSFKKAVEARLDKDRISTFISNDIDKQRVFFALNAKSVRGDTDEILLSKRRYPWGDADPMDPEHSDLVKLRSLLLRRKYYDVKDGKEEYREAYLRQFFLKRRLNLLYKRNHRCISIFFTVFLLALLALVCCYVTWHITFSSSLVQREVWRNEALQDARVQQAIMEQVMDRRRAELEAELETRTSEVGELRDMTKTLDEFRTRLAHSTGEYKKMQLLYDDVQLRHQNLQTTLSVFASLMVITLGTAMCWMRRR